MTYLTTALDERRRGTGLSASRTTRQSSTAALGGAAVVGASVDLPEGAVDGAMVRPVVRFWVVRPERGLGLVVIETDVFLEERSANSVALVCQSVGIGILR